MKSCTELYTNIRIYKCLQWITQNIYLIYRYFELYHRKKGIINSISKLMNMLVYNQKYQIELPGHLV